MITVTVSFPEDMLDKLDLLAGKNDASRAALIRLAVTHLFRSLARGEPISLVGITTREVTS
jgi:metal-responsive CopG/Arc/MetJ family transcriptional regulator